MSDLLDLFISSYTSVCFTMASPPSCGCLSVHQLSVKLKMGSPILFIAYDFSSADSDGLHDHLRDVPWENIFKLSASAAASDFCECVQVGIDAYIPHPKYQVKPQLSSWFSAAFAAAIVYRNHFFV